MLVGAACRGLAGAWGPAEASTSSGPVPAPGCAPRPAAPLQGCTYLQSVGAPGVRGLGERGECLGASTMLISYRAQQRNATVQGPLHTLHSTQKLSTADWREARHQGSAAEPGQPLSLLISSAPPAATDPSSARADPHNCCKMGSGHGSIKQEDKNRHARRMGPNVLLLCFYCAFAFQHTQRPRMAPQLPCHPFPLHL